MFRLRHYLIQVYLVGFDLAIISACYVAVCAHLTRWSAESLLNSPFKSARVDALATVLILWVAFSFYFGMYHSRRLDRPFADFIIIVKVSAATLITLEGFSRLMTSLEWPASILVRLLTLCVVCLAIARLLLRLIICELRRRGHNVKKMILITSPKLGRRLAEKFDRHAHFGYVVLCNFLYFSNSQDEADALVNSVQSYLSATQVDDAIIALPAHANDLAAKLIQECENYGINIRIVPDLFSLVRADTQVHNLDGIPLVNVHYYPTDNFGYIVLKRAFDITASLAALITLAPLFLLIAVLIKLTSEGPMFFTQERVGLNGKPFRMLKFRTMREGPEMKSGNHWTRRNDPHVTPLGRWLRRSNLDELPQFLNVLLGDMSVVGPRPERQFFLEQFRREVPEYMARHYVKSGITGWAQVNGWRGDTSIPQRVAHDLYYIRNWAIGFDFKILLLTLTRTFFHRNAY
jgi:Undecaprenyl-phosphate glucose phosphotransferase